MKVLREASEDEVLLSFLKGELKSHRFRGELIAAMERLGVDEAIICHADLQSQNENTLRRELMRQFRGYPDSGIFTNFPQILKWAEVTFTASDLNHIYYIDYCYWNELSKGTSSPLEAAETVKAGVEIYNQPNDNFFDARAYLEKGKRFDPIVLITCGEKYLAVEGHVRLTAYAMWRESFENASGYVGFCTAQEMQKKDPRMIS